MKPLAAFLIVAWALPGTARAQTVTYENETTPYPGLRLLERHTEDPNWRIYAAFVSLCEAGVSIDARSPQNVRITAPTWGSAMGAQLAVNGDFFRTDTSVPTVYGDAVGVGMRWPAAQTGRDPAYAGDWYYEHYGWIAFGPGWVEFSHTGWVKEHAADLDISEGFSPTEITTEIPAGTFALVSGFPELVVEGEARSSFPDRGDTKDRHPRTAMGLSADRRTFMLVVVDGRSTASVGMTGGELAALMKELGAYTAFNLDGGGSSQMWLAGEGLVNDPSDGSPRPVANLWGVFTGGMGQQESSCTEMSAPDAGMMGGGDAGPVDAGTDSGEDANTGTGADATGPMPTEMDGGCQVGMKKDGGQGLAAVILLGGLALASRRRARLASRRRAWSRRG